VLHNTTSVGRIPYRSAPCRRRCDWWPCLPVWLVLSTPCPGRGARSMALAARKDEAPSVGPNIPKKFLLGAPLPGHRDLCGGPPWGWGAMGPPLGQGQSPSPCDGGSLASPPPRRPRARVWFPRPRLRSKHQALRPKLFLRHPRPALRAERWPVAVMSGAGARVDGGDGPPRGNWLRAQPKIRAPAP
jgi:hypothetical protein